MQQWYDNFDLSEKDMMTETKLEIVLIKHAIGLARGTWSRYNKALLENLDKAVSMEGDFALIAQEVLASE